MVWCNSKPSCILHEVINHIVKYRTWQCHRTGFTDYTHSIATMNHTPIKPDKQWYLLCNIRNYSGNTQNTEQKGINHEMGMTKWKKEKWAGRSSIATSLLTVYIWISSKHWGWLDEKGRSEAAATDKDHVNLGLHSSVFWCGISWTQQVRDPFVSTSGRFWRLNFGKSKNQMPPRIENREPNWLWIFDSRFWESSDFWVSQNRPKAETNRAKETPPLFALHFAEFFSNPTVQ